MRAVVRAQLAASLDGTLVDELLAAHAEAKHNFYLGGLRLAEVEAGRFCEAAFRLLEQIAGFTRTPLGRQLDTDRLIGQLGNLPGASHPDAVRLHIPRALRFVYDIRNKRDAAHLGDGIDPNLQDAAAVAGSIDWVLAEFVRLYHHISASDAQQLVDMIVTRRAPVVQDFDGFLKVLNPKLKAGDFCLVVLYQRGSVGATFVELSKWARPGMRSNLKATLYRLVHARAFVHDDRDKNRYVITYAGQREVETRKLVLPDA
jgi:hypothetical protein